VNNDVHTLTGAYVLDALSEMERRAFEDHMAGCPACYQEVAELRETTARLGTATAANPPPLLWNKVLTATMHARQLPPPQSEDRVVVRPKRWGTRVAVFAAAASIVAAAGIGVGWYVTNNDLQDQLAQTQSEQNRLVSVLSAPDRKVVSAPITGGGIAVAVVSERQNSMVMTVLNAAPLPPNKAYQLWYVKDAGPTPAGQLAASSGSISADDLAPAAGATALAITVEPAAGSQKPTSDILMKVDL
jgi:anti-sigma-K factor RskA